MDFKKLLKSFSYDERQLLFRLLRSEFEKPKPFLEKPSRERDKDLTVEEWLIDTMEQYANYGFHQIEEKLRDSPNYFFRNTGFLNMILDLVDPKEKVEQVDDIEEL